MESQILMDEELFERVIDRLAHQLLEHHDFNNTDLVGLQPRGYDLAKILKVKLEQLLPGSTINCGGLDSTFHRDDFRRREKPITPQSTSMPFLVEGRDVILVDDVLFTGRTIRAGLDALLAHGRPETVKLLVLVDRRFQRELPIEPQFIGKSIDSIDWQYVQVIWNAQRTTCRVMLLNKKPE
ncbi:bifunctional pyr operon transcriptional regulator/uracil phosphoribosyltransferase PyrR [Flavobacteriales bacterium]|nr:bifunctional pyr operon transcriptional regulator/uracil phosphoribosyltransferase PyrR [Flavobacteriales bacterium]